MKFLSNLWNRFTLSVEEFIADLLGEDTLAQSDFDSQQVSAAVETDSFESW